MRRRSLVAQPETPAEIAPSPHHLRRQFLSRLGVLAGSTALLGYDLRCADAEPPPETTRIRLIKTPIICAVPQFLAEQLLRAEGFTDVQYVYSLKWNEPLPSGEADISMVFAPPQVLQIEADAPIVVLAGGHIGCVELVGRESIRSTLDLKGKTIAVSDHASDEKIFLSLFLSYAGLDPRRDVQWAIYPIADNGRLFEEGKIDAFMTGPPFGAELRARRIGRVLVNTTIDRPWSQYFCCLVTGNKEFVRTHPVATKRVLRALLKANDICAAEPERTARFLVSKHLASTYELALRAVKELPYGQWREYDPEDTVRFYALRLQEAGLMHSSPQKIIAQGTNWRFLNELKKELKA
jgi:NitT/TauT family transport system substrate-binding protein